MRESRVTTSACNFYRDGTNHSNLIPKKILNKSNRIPVQILTSAEMRLLTKNVYQ